VLIDDFVVWYEDNQEEAEKMKGARLQLEKQQKQEEQKERARASPASAKQAAAQPAAAAAAGGTEVGSSRKRSRSVSEGEPGWSSSGEDLPTEVTSCLGGNEAAVGGSRLKEKALVGKGMRFVVRTSCGRYLCEEADRKPKYVTKDANRTLAMFEKAKTFLSLQDSSTKLVLVLGAKQLICKRKALPALLQAGVVVSRNIE
jgi:hypothetical protein